MKPDLVAGPGLDTLEWADWKPGPLAKSRNPVVVSLTDFDYDSKASMEEAFGVGLGLRRTWPVMHGAVGLWLWGAPGLTRGGAVSVWDDVASLMRFVRWPVHVRIMATWRDRGFVTSEKWTEKRFDPDTVRAVAEARLRRAWEQ